MTDTELNGDAQDRSGGRPADPEPQYELRRVLREDWPLLLLFVLAFAGAAWIHPMLPERVPSHWDTHGQVDGWSTPASATFGMLGMFLGLYALLAALPLFDPRRRNYAKFLPTHRIVRWTMVLMCLGIWAFATMAATGAQVHLGVVVPAAVSLVVIVMGNFMGRLRHNWFIGIRTPWSLANEEAWRLTHRAAGPAWVIGGLIALVGAFAGGMAAVAAMAVGVGGASVFSIVYSYFAYRRSLRSATSSPTDGA